MEASFTTISTAYWIGRQPLPNPASVFARPAQLRKNSFSGVRCAEAAPNAQRGERQRPAEFKRGLTIPRKLLGAGPSSLAGPVKHTVYTLRFRTSSGRGSSLEVPFVGVQVCLVGKDGSAVLQRVSPVYDPAQVEKDAVAICQVVDREAGVDSARMLKAAASGRASSAAVKARFQAGSVEEISFLGPELGPLASIMVAPEEGTWRCDEITVSSSRSRHTDRFVCKEALGSANCRMAFLSPVPPDMVVYGSGEAALILTREQAAALHAMGMLDYCALKGRILVTTAALVAAGSSLCYSVGGWPATEPFLAGGCGGLLYQKLLQAGVDALPSGSSGLGPASGPGEAAQRVLGSPAVRLGAVTALSLAAVWTLRATGDGAGLPADAAQLGQMLEVRQVLTGIMGFMMYKLAILGVTAVPSPPRERERFPV